MERGRVMNEARMIKYHGLWRIHLNDDEAMRKKIAGNILYVEDSEEILIDLNAYNLRLVRRTGVPLSKNLRIIYNRMFKGTQKVPDIILPALSLRTYQHEGVEFLLSRKGKVLLADDMGLGKTPQVLVWLESVRPNLTILVCPTSLKYMWQEEYKKFYPKGTIEFIILEGRTNYALEPEEGTVYVINFEILPFWVEYLTSLEPDALIVDEAHNAKTVKSQRGRAVDMLSVVCTYKIMITGTPVLNTLADIWTLVRYVNPMCLGGWTAFCSRYLVKRDVTFWKRVWDPKRGVSVRKKIHTADYSKTRRTKELNKLLHATVMLRRMKSEVLKQLPPKQRQYIWIDVNNKELDRARKDWIRASKKDGVQAKESVRTFAVMRKLLAESKVELAMEWIQEARAKMGDKPLIVVGWHRSPLQKLHDAFPGSVLLQGGSSSSVQKHRIVKDFQKGKIPILFMNMQSGGTGTTLTRADTTLFLELPLTDGLLTQAEDRTHRISQTSKKVRYVYILIRNSIEERVMEIIINKRKLGADVLDRGIDTRKIMDYLLDGRVDSEDTPEPPVEFKERKKEDGKANRK